MKNDTREFSTNIDLTGIGTQTKLREPGDKKQNKIIYLSTKVRVRRF